MEKWKDVGREQRGVEVKGKKRKRGSRDPERKRERRGERNGFENEEKNRGIREVETEETLKREEGEYRIGERMKG